MCLQVFQVFNRVLRSSKVGILLADTSVQTGPHQISWLTLKNSHKYDVIFDLSGSRLATVQTASTADGLRVI
jgi:hypothetical protein